MARPSSNRIQKLPHLPATAVFSEYESLFHRELRWEAILPVRIVAHLRGGGDEVIPGEIINLSASGLLIIVDERFSLLLPPAVGAHFEVEFFLDALEIRQVPIEVRRVERRDLYQCALGCVFISLPREARLALRGEISARLAAKRHRR